LISWCTALNSLETDIKGLKAWKNGIIRVSAPLFCLCERYEHGVDVCLRAQAALEAALEGQRTVGADAPYFIAPGYSVKEIISSLLQL